MPPHILYLNVTCDDLDQKIGTKLKVVIIYLARVLLELTWHCKAVNQCVRFHDVSMRIMLVKRRLHKYHV